MNDAQQQWHIPFRLLAWCQNCDECFNLTNRVCSACGSINFVVMSSWIEYTVKERTRRAAIQ